MSFYRVDESQFYLRPSDFKIMTDEQLNAIIEAGLIDWEQYQREQRKKAFQKRFNIFAAVMMAVGGAALLTAGPAAAGPAVQAAGTGAATGAGATATGTFAKIQKVASWISKGAGIAGKATGSDSANQLAAAANLISSPSMTSAIERGVEFQLREDGADIAKDDANAKLAMRELIAREQADYAAALRYLAEEEAAATGTVVTVEPKKPVTLQDILPYAIPVVLTVLLG